MRGRSLWGAASWLLIVSAVGLAAVLALSFRRLDDRGLELTLGQGLHRKPDEWALWLVFAAAILGYAWLARRLSLGRVVSPAAALLVGAAPLLMVVGCLSETFEFAADSLLPLLTDDAVVRGQYALLGTMSGLRDAATLSCALFLALGVVVAFTPGARCARWTPQSIVLSVLLTTPALLAAASRGPSTERFALLVGVPCFVALSTVLSASGPAPARIGRLFLSATSFAMAALMLHAMRVAEAVSCAFQGVGYHQSSREECFEYLLPPEALLAAPWIPVAVTLALASLVVARLNRLRLALRGLMGALPAVAAVCWLCWHGQARIIGAIDDSLPVHAPKNFSVVVPPPDVWLHWPQLGPIVGASPGAVWGHLGEKLADDPFSLAARRRLARGLRGHVRALVRSDGRSEDPWSERPTLALAAAPDLRGAELRALFAAAHLAGAGQVAWVAAEPDWDVDLTDDPRTWVRRLGARRYAARAQMTHHGGAHLEGVVAADGRRLNLEWQDRMGPEALRLSGPRWQTSASVREERRYYPLALPLYVRLEIGDDATPESLVGVLSRLQAGGYESVIAVDCDDDHW